MSPVKSSDDKARRVARQHAETSRLLGVDFLPVRVHSPVASPEEPGVAAPAAPAAAATQAHSARSDAVASSKLGLLEELHRRHDAECPHCTRATAHTRTVFGEGNPDARVMFVGEAPGAEEDRTGRPFVGRSGELLDKMIASMGLKREDVYIANVLKARPPDNATPTTDEAAKCGPYLRKQIRIIRPEALITLGKPAAQLLLDTREAMGALRGRWFEYEGIPLMPTFHPAYLLRQYTAENRTKVWSDIKLVMERLGIQRK